MATVQIRQKGNGNSIDKSSLPPCFRLFVSFPIKNFERTFSPWHQCCVQHPHRRTSPMAGRNRSPTELLWLYQLNSITSPITGSRGKVLTLLLLPWEAFVCDCLCPICSNCFYVLGMWAIVCSSCVDRRSSKMKTINTFYLSTAEAAFMNASTANYHANVCVW